MPTKRPRKSRTRRVHTAQATLHVGELTKAGTSLMLEIFHEGEKIGTVEIGRGSLFWKGGGRKNWKRLPWWRFADVMDKLAYGG